MQCTNSKKVRRHCAALRSSSIFLFSSSFLALANKRWWNFYKKFWVLFLVATSWDSLWSLLSIIIKKSWHLFKIHLLHIGILLLVIDIPKKQFRFWLHFFYLMIFDTITICLDQDFEPQNGTPACKESLYINSSFPYPPFLLSYRFRKLVKLIIWFNLIWKEGHWNILDLTLIFGWEK